MIYFGSVIFYSAVCTQLGANQGWDVTFNLTTGPLNNFCPPRLSSPPPGGVTQSVWLLPRCYQQLQRDEEIKT